MIFLAALSRKTGNMYGASLPLLTVHLGSALRFKCILLENILVFPAQFRVGGEGVTDMRGVFLTTLPKEHLLSFKAYSCLSGMTGGLNSSGKSREIQSNLCAVLTMLFLVQSHKSYKYLWGIGFWSGTASTGHAVVGCLTLWRSLELHVRCKLARAYFALSAAWGIISVAEMSCSILVYHRAADIINSTSYDDGM